MTMTTNTIQDGDNQYFAAKDGNKTASVLLSKIGEWTDNLNSVGFLEKLRSSYASYYGAYYSDVGSGHQITFGGEQGELTNLPINHYRNIANHILVMTTSNRPDMQARATNTDYKSLVQTSLAGNILEYYLREKRLEKYLKTAVELAIALGAGYIKMEWDSQQGEMVDYIEETKTKIYEGDIVFSNLSPFDVVVDGSKESNDHDWVLIRTWKNKYDLAAKYPEYADKIKGLPTKYDLQRIKIGVTNLVDNTDDIPVMEFYHKRTECMPDGRYMMILTEEIIPQDLPMPYRVIPIFRIAPSNILGTPHGYTPMFDLLPLQEMINALYSTVASNQNAFGVQNVLNPRGTDIAVNQLVGGLNVIDYNAQAGKPEPLQLTNTPAEVFKFIQMIEQAMETLSGVNSVARGNPEASLKSGTALALVQSMALQFMSGLQQSYVELIEDIGTAIVKMLQDYANTPRLVAISGKSNRTYMKEFSGKDISNISRVVVDVGNPMANTTAGRVQMAQELIQYGEITPKQYIELIHTGNLDAITEAIEDQQLLMRSENEAMMEGESPIVAPIDDHPEHILSHRSILADPDLRKDPDLVQRVMDHIQQHINDLKTVDPDLLQLLKMQPLRPPQPPAPPPMGSPGPPGPMAPPMPPQGPPMMGPPPGAPPMQPPQQGHPVHRGRNGTPIGAPHGSHVPKNIIPNEMMPPEQGIQGLQIAGNHIAGPGLQRAEKLPSQPNVNAALLPNPQLEPRAINHPQRR